MIVTIGKYEEALVYYEEALKGRLIVLGDYHPDTIDTVKKIIQVRSFTISDSFLCRFRPCSLFCVCVLLCCHRKTQKRIFAIN